MNKTVFISGATSGIGKSCAFIFAKNNYQLILTGRRKDRLEQIKNDLQNEFHVKILTLCFDVTDLKQTQNAIRQIDKTIFPTIDILINNAGLASGLSSIDEGLYEDWNVMIDTNVKGLLHVTRELLPTFKEQGFGHIVNISSTAGKDAYPNGNVYCATKHAVDALSKSMRIDLLNYGIKVTSINPGACETEFSIVRFKGDEQRAKKVYEGFTPLKPEDVADAVFYTATLPKHVCINDLTITCLTQANAHYHIKKVIE
ncbi:MAG TPA: SDR family NAD(P)-dependent oxidoreductase [Chitinophagaceae bacterium]|nr:MAG: short-chain alcohol dehydrogenase [Bacteroidetes bacterium OLB11]HMN31914.1 SDR family NAD(P)-dependent oxidoreductase [Chitinophagaceae bacterium]